MNYPSPLHRLVLELKKLPGIGQKTAQRLAFYILGVSDEVAFALAEAIINAKKKLFKCTICGNFSETEVCRICRDPKRDPTILCVVETPVELFAIEKTGIFPGKYHVLMGAISPLDGVGPEKLRIKQLLNRIEGGIIKEVFLATSPNVSGEATAIYIANLLKPKGIRVTRIARGVPVGSELEYIDKTTLVKAIEGRRDL